MKYIDEDLPPRRVVRNKLVGEINIPDGKVDITDPGYEDDTWCAMFGHDVKPGKYKCFIEKINFPVKYELEVYDIKPNSKEKAGDIIECNDIRIMSLRIIHESESINSFRDYEIVNENIGVDAGLCGFYNHKPDYSNEKEWLKFYDECGYDNPTCLCKPDGITVSSGFGDGVYTLKEAKNNNGEVVALELLFY